MVQLCIYFHDFFLFSASLERPQAHAVKVRCVSCVQIGRVSAEDRDSERYNNFEYRLQSGSVAESFSVDSQTGEITARTSLDRESRAIHQFNIIAFDLQAQTMSSTAVVSVQV